MSATNIQESQATDTGPKIGLQLRLFAKTDTGKVRELNEDNFCIVLPSSAVQNEKGQVNLADDEAMVLAVADGMGGTNAGEVAARIAIETVRDNINLIGKLAASGVGIEGTLRNIIIQAHERILDHAIEDQGTQGMGTTIVLAYLQRNIVHVGWCGDSRAYKFNPAGIERVKSYDLPKTQILTDDHSLVWQKVMRGEMDANSARINEMSNVITQSLGDPLAGPKPDIATYILQKEERLLICSDGLNSMLPDEYIEQVLSESGTPEQITHRLIEEANNAGGNDNISVIVVFIDNAPPFNKSEVTNIRPVAITAKSSPISTPGKIATLSLKGFKLSRRNTFLIFLALALILIFIFQMVFRNGNLNQILQGPDNTIPKTHKDSLSKTEPTIDNEDKNTNNQISNLTSVEITQNDRDKPTTISKTQNSKNQPKSIISTVKLSENIFSSTYIASSTGIEDLRKDFARKCSELDEEISITFNKLINEKQTAQTDSLRKSVQDLSESLQRIHHTTMIASEDQLKTNESLLKGLQTSFKNLKSILEKQNANPSEIKPIDSIRQHGMNADTTNEH